MNAKELKIIFMGTPEFAVYSLKSLFENNFNIVAVVTAPDKPAGRGQKLTQSEVKKYAIEKNLRIFQPEKLKDQFFLKEIKGLNPDLIIVVAFRMLPEEVWSIPQYGTFNLHASLLPQYRGAAPINHAIINGEKITGATTFFIDKDIDTGKIILQEQIQIGENETAGELHDRLMILGAKLVIDTVNVIASGNFNLMPQEKLVSNEALLKKAPKISKEFCKINWNKSVDEIHNFIRGLSPYPGAYTYLIKNTEKIQLKIYNAHKEISVHSFESGKLFIDNNKKFIKVAVNNGFIIVDKLQAEGRKLLSSEEFIRGFKDLDSYVLSV
jgi:methionyl-tRNA formyltransferase